MTFHISFRSDATFGASVAGGRGFETKGLAPAGAVEIDIAAIGRAAAGKHVLFACHGFNVRWSDALTSAARLEDDLYRPNAPLPLGPDSLFVGVTWPGDWWVKVVNYSFEADDAVRSGDFLAKIIDAHFGAAASISFVSHSLGARVVLTAAKLMRAAPREIIVTAAAADNDCLSKQYDAARRRAARVSVLSSKRDLTLRFAYPLGDAVSDALGDGDSIFGGALGRHGPKPANTRDVAHLPIPGAPHDSGGTRYPLSDFDHTDYFPSSKTPPDLRKSGSVSRYTGAAFANAPPLWR